MKKDFYFAAVGDVHGEIYTMLGLLQKWEERNKQNLSFVLQVGDFEPHRSEVDLETMDAPKKYKKIGFFPDFHRGNSLLPYPIWFIGGNHEPHSFLELTPHGAEIIPNCHYFGRVGCVNLHNLKVVGVSGIYKQEIFKELVRPKIQDSKDFNFHSTYYIGFLESEIKKSS